MDEGSLVVKQSRPAGAAKEAKNKNERTTQNFPASEHNPAEELLIDRGVDKEAKEDTGPPLLDGEAGRSSGKALSPAHDVESRSESIAPGIESILSIVTEDRIGPEIKSKEEPPDPSVDNGTLVAEGSGLEPEKGANESHSMGEEDFEQDGKNLTETIGAKGVDSSIQAPQPVVSPVVAAPQDCVDKWPALFADGKTDIHFDNGNLWSFSNEVKGLIENFIGAPVNWRPLSARRKPLPNGFSRVRWKCVSRTPSRNGETSLITLRIALWEKLVGYHVNGS